MMLREAEDCGNDIACIHCYSFSPTKVMEWTAIEHIEHGRKIIQFSSLFQIQLVSLINRH